MFCVLVDGLGKCLCSATVWQRLHRQPNSDIYIFQLLALVFFDRKALKKILCERSKDQLVEKKISEMGCLRKPSLSVF